MTEHNQYINMEAFIKELENDGRDIAHRNSNELYRLLCKQQESDDELRQAKKRVEEFANQINMFQVRVDEYRKMLDNIETSLSLGRLSSSFDVYVRSRVATAINKEGHSYCVEDPGLIHPTLHNEYMWCGHTHESRATFVDKLINHIEECISSWKKMGTTEPLVFLRSFEETEFMYKVSFSIGGTKPLVETTQPTTGESFNEITEPLQRVFGLQIVTRKEESTHLCDGLVMRFPLSTNYSKIVASIFCELEREHVKGKYTHLCIDRIENVHIYVSLYRRVHLPLMKGTKSDAHERDCLIAVRHMLGNNSFLERTTESFISDTDTESFSFTYTYRMIPLIHLDSYLVFAANATASCIQFNREGVNIKQRYSAHVNVYTNDKYASIHVYCVLFKSS